jgi:hypothetical protein
MRRLTLAAGAACAVVLIGPLGAQNSNDFSMPGQVVGSSDGAFSPVGNRAPSAAPAAGQPVGKNALQRPFDPNRPYDQFKGTGIDPSLLRAPLVGPDGREVAPPGPLSDFLARIKSVFVKNPPPERTIPYAPGISRRNRERAEQRRMWRLD